jgi:hypothetical protein
MGKEPVLVSSAVLVVLQVLTAGAAFTDVVGKDAAGLAILVVAALQAGLAFLVRGQVSPVE